MKESEHNNGLDADFDFDEWAEVYRTDPEAFERRRAEWIENYIRSAPSRLQQRLRGLMFRVDIERQRARNPVDACVRLTGMMWDSFTDLQRELGNQLDPNHVPDPPPKEARVIPFNQRPPTRKDEDH